MLFCHRIVCNIIPELKSFPFLHEDGDKELFALNDDGSIDEDTGRRFDFDVTQEYFIKIGDQVFLFFK
jgi:hypothetical protein